MDSATTEVTSPTPPPGSPAETTPVEPSSFDEQHAVFVTQGRASVKLSALGPCWVAVTRSDGTKEFQGVLQPGDQHRVEEAVPIQIRLGNPTAVDVTINGSFVRIPATPGQPFDLDLRPSSA